MKITISLSLLNMEELDQLISKVKEIIPDAELRNEKNIAANLISEELIICDDSLLKKSNIQTLKYLIDTNDHLKSILIYSLGNTPEIKEILDDGIIACFTNYDELQQFLQDHLSRNKEPQIPIQPTLVVDETDQIESDTDSSVPVQTPPLQHQETPQVNINVKTEDAEEIHKKIERFKKEIGVAKLDVNKTIGVWSPISKSGVTEFVTNFAIYLANQGVELSVLESITNRPKLKRQLERYSKNKNTWCSYTTYLFEESHDPKECKWLYNHLHWFPCDYKDSEYEWTHEKIYEYIKGLQHYDVTLVDFPTGEMNSLSIQVLTYIDELWIVCNHFIEEWLEWDDYIKSLKQHVPHLHIIFNAKHPSIPSPRLVIEKQIGETVLAEIPAAFEESAINEISTKPLILNNENIFNAWRPSFEKLEEHTLGYRHSVDTVDPFYPPKRILNRLTRFFTKNRGRIK